MPQNSTEITASISDRKSPRSVLPGIFAFPPNRDTLGGTSYFILDKNGNILLDSPSWNDINRDFLLARGGVDKLVLTHRGGMGKSIATIQQELNCQVILQEQEAYLLPEVKVNSFIDTLSLSGNLELIWTPGHSPGSSCLYYSEHGGILFSGRHLLPKSATEIAPLRTAKTFHWWRQLNSIAMLRDRFTPDTLKYILPGANTGYLRGKAYIDRAYRCLTELDLASLKQIEPLG
jgi:glyoxylase-like metal-dependent hydrolase (beta-lactamase superfamily II)